MRNIKGKTIVYLFLLFGMKKYEKSLNYNSNQKILIFVTREVNITKFEKDSPNDYSTSFQNNILDKKVVKKSNTSSNSKRSRGVPERKEDNDVTDLTVDGKATAPATKTRSRKGMLQYLPMIMLWNSLI